MILDRVSSGHNVPNDINVVIEIPSHSDPVKYEVDKDTGAMFVDRFMGTAMHYPCNYGYVPQTLSEDGDPVDVLVVTPIPVISGSVIRVRPLGMLCMTDEAGKRRQDYCRADRQVVESLLAHEQCSRSATLTARFDFAFL